MTTRKSLQRGQTRESMLDYPQSLTTKPKREGGVRLFVNLALDSFVWVKTKVHD
jgi:hypothetical protein